MSKIRFQRIVSEARFHNPLRDFAEDRHKREIRKDPLLGDTSVYNPYLKDKAKAFFGDSDPDLIQRLVEESEKTCFFCGEKVEKGTPRFTADFLPEGRLRVGEAILFPNLFSLGMHHPVVCLCKAHFLRLSGFHPDLIADGLTAVQKFLKIVYEKDASAVFAAVTANYLFPAGASLAHPHTTLLMAAFIVGLSLHGAMYGPQAAFIAELGFGPEGVLEAPHMELLPAIGAALAQDGRQRPVHLAALTELLGARSSPQPAEAHRLAPLFADEAEWERWEKARWQHRVERNCGARRGRGTVLLGGGFRLDEHQDGAGRSAGTTGLHPLH